MPLAAALVVIVVFFWPTGRLNAQNGFQDLPVADVQITGVTPEEQKRLQDLIDVKRNEPFRLEKIRQSIERLYATGRFDDIQADVQQHGNAVSLTFITKENFFVGSVTIAGAAPPPTRAQLESATRLELGHVFTDEQLQEAVDRIKRVLEENGYYRANVKPRVELDDKTQQARIHFQIEPGERAEIEEVRVTGNAVFPIEKIRDKSKLKRGKDVTARRLQDAVNRIRRYYQEKDYLEASVRVGERIYVPDKNTAIVVLAVDAGPQVDIRVEGAKLSRGRRRELIPIYEEGTVDADLVREGENNIRNYFQSKGHFDAQVSAHLHEKAAEKISVEYHIKPGEDHEVQEIVIDGNKYFDDFTIRERMAVMEGGLLNDGRFSRQLLDRDVQAIRNLYAANGFQNVKVTGDVEDDYRGKQGDMLVRILIDEGPQTLVNSLTIHGNHDIGTDEISALLASTQGQPYSEFNVLVDRDTVLTHYFNSGFQEATFHSEAKPLPGRRDRVNIEYQISEGPRRYVDQVLISGLDKTRRHIVEEQVRVRPGKPLSQQELLDTQRQLYELGIFQKVEVAIQNPEGVESHKNVLIDMDEARRYTVGIGGGADIARIGRGDPEAQTTPEGNTGFSPRVSLDVTRLNFRGLNHTVAFKSRVSTLQKRASLTYTAPRVFNLPSLTWLFNGFYDQTYDVVTFRSERLEGSVALQQRRPNTDVLLYRYSYRRVKAEADTLLVDINTVRLFERPVRVGMLGASFVRDRRDEPADARRGMYLTLDGGASAKQVGSEASFFRSVLQYATYHRLRPNLVLARSTQVGLADPFGEGRRVPRRDPATGQTALDAEGGELFDFVLDVPLPERFFSGGSNSHRGFGVNQAGPRDLVTGFPIGGEALLVNTVELRFPLIGPNIGGALFHDAGNVFSSIGDISLRMRQRDQADFNYIVHAVGVGVRYKTPVGPVRFDVAYSVNPPTYRGLVGSRRELMEGRGRPETRTLSHFQFFFSIGQTF